LSDSFCQGAKTVNPDGLRNQIVGANIMGLGGALFKAIEFENDRILNARFSRYRVPRFRGVPEIQVVLLDRKDLPSSGAGETPLVGLAPALGNARNDANSRVHFFAMAPVPSTEPSSTMIISTCSGSHWRLAR
jgi:CO/xanthine dehydrogenase Mo-binding subunit